VTSLNGGDTEPASPRRTVSW